MLLICEFVTTCRATLAVTRQPFANPHVLVTATRAAGAGPELTHSSLTMRWFQLSRPSSPQEGRALFSIRPCSEWNAASANAGWAL